MENNVVKKDESKVSQALKSLDSVISIQSDLLDHLGEILSPACYSDKELGEMEELKDKEGSILYMTIRDTKDKVNRNNDVIRKLIDTLEL